MGNSNVNVDVINVFTTVDADDFASFVYETQISFLLF